MFYSIRHATHFRYSAPVRESLMEVRMHPRSEAHQRCLTFVLSVSPRAHVHTYRDHVGNMVHHFAAPGQHARLLIVAESVVSLQPAPELPDSLGAEAWDELDAGVREKDFHETLSASHFARPYPQLDELARTLGVVRRGDPLQLLRELNQRVYEWFDYRPQATRVDSPISEALRSRAGVCQDFAHVMIALVRPLGVPCRYVSGYLHHRVEDQDRSSDGATHAWVEAWLPGLGWVGFDPTNNLIAGGRHIRTAVGRDYADVPPTRGVFKGTAETELSVSVSVAPSDALAPWEEERPPESWSTFEARELAAEAEAQQAQQQQ